MSTPRRPRFLMVAPAMPAEAGNGLAIRLGMFLEALAVAGDTDLVVVPVAGPAGDPPLLAQRLGVRWRVLELRGRCDTHFGLLMRLADPTERLAAFRLYGRPSLAAGLSLPVLGEIRRLAAERRYDLIHVGRLYLAEAAVLPELAARRTIDLDDDDCDVWRGRATVMRREGDHAAAAWAHAEADAFASLAQRVLPTFDAVFHAGGPIGIFPSAEHVQNAVRPGAPRFADDGRTLVFIGALSYQPNLDGIRWFARDAWPGIRRAAPAARLLVAGRAPAVLAALHGRNGISLVGPVADLDSFYRTAALAIAPLRSGGGTRIKLIEAAGRGVPFVATSVASAGLSFGNDRCGWVADDEEDFAQAVLAALAGRAERRRRAARAFRLAVVHHRREMVVSRLAQRFRSLAAAARPTV